MKQYCPNCKRHYETILNRPKDDKRLLQEIFPYAPAYQREQLITGLCSDKCWTEYIGNEEWPE